MITTHAPWLKRLPAPIYKLAAQAWIDYRWPRHLFIETTAACNLHCAYCPREHLTDHMDFGLFQRIVDEGARFGPRSYSAHLFGESLLYPRWREAVRYIHARNRRNRLLLTTNGTTLNRVVDDLIATNPDLVLWTWRPEAKFTAATKAKLWRWGKFRVRFIQEITPKEAYLEWADWPNVEGRQLHNYGANIDLQSFGVRPTASQRWPCYHLWLAPAVSWNGDLLLCCADPKKQEILGRFPAMSVAEMWRSAKLQTIRRAHRDGRYEGICKDCDVWKQYPDLFFGWQKKSSA